MNKELSITSIQKQTIFYFLIIWVISWLFSLVSYAHIFQLQNPPFINVGIDNSFWGMHLLGIPQYLGSHRTMAFITEIILFLLPFSLLTKWRNIGALLFLILFTIVTISQQSLSSTTTKSGVSPLLMMIPFVFNGRKFVLTREGIRYYLLMLFVGAGLFKFVNGGIFEIDQFSNIMTNQHRDLQILNPDHIAYTITEYFSSHWVMAQSLYVSAFLLQCSFIIGFFTKKMDQILYWFLIFFCLMSFFLMRIYNFDLLFLGAALFPASTQLFFKKDHH